MSGESTEDTEKMTRLLDKASARSPFNPGTSWVRYATADFPSNTTAKRWYTSESDLQGEKSRAHGLEWSRSRAGRLSEPPSGGRSLDPRLLKVDFLLILKPMNF